MRNLDTIEKSYKLLIESLDNNLYCRNSEKYLIDFYPLKMRIRDLLYDFNNSEDYDYEDYDYEDFSYSTTPLPLQ